MKFVLDFVADNPVETLILVFGSLVAIGGVATYTSKRTRTEVRTEGAPKTLEEIAYEGDDTIRIPRGGTYGVAQAHDLTMRLQLRPVHSHEPTVPVTISTPEEPRWPA